MNRWLLAAIAAQQNKQKLFFSDGATYSWGPLGKLYHMSTGYDNDDEDGSSVWWEIIADNDTYNPLIKDNFINIHALIGDGSPTAPYGLNKRRQVYWFANPIDTSKFKHIQVQLDSSRSGSRDAHLALKDVAPTTRDATGNLYEWTRSLSERVATLTNEGYTLLTNDNTNSVIMSTSTNLVTYTIPSTITGKKYLCIVTSGSTVAATVNINGVYLPIKYFSLKK